MTVRADRAVGAVQVHPRPESEPLKTILRQHRDVDRLQEAGGVYSVCSAHAWVLAAAVIQAREDGVPLLVEATSNQVNQDGGYTGMRPADFRDLVYRIAAQHNLPTDMVVLGGDHLGPNVWRELGAEQAMERAEEMISAYVGAGFTKIHLDCSMSCAGDPGMLTDEVVAGRAARLAAQAERTAYALGGAPTVERLGYVIGTEVPVPGGAHETIEELEPTSATAARKTIEAHRKAFAALGLAEAWKRVLAVVVQPGVEFDHQRVIAYDRSQVAELRTVVEEHTSLVFEAHSTDYQRVEELRALVEDHWAILKVGPGLTFALREALFALASIEDELVAESDRSDLVAVVERVMLSEEHWWRDYYEGSADDQRLARRYSYSDRLRYYWPHPDIVAAQKRLVENLRSVNVPLPLVSAFLPTQYSRVRDGGLLLDPESIAVDRVRDVLRDYASACHPTA